MSIRTACAHCGQPLNIALDHTLKYRVQETEAAPLVFEPHVDWQTFSEPNIIDAY